MIKPAVEGEYSVEADDDEEDHVEAEVIEHADGWWWNCITGRWNACKRGDDGRMILTALGGRLRWSSSKDI